MKRWVMFTSFLFAMVSVFPAQAAVFQVTTPAELQAALTTARNNGESDIIHVAQGTYVGNFWYNPLAGENFDLTLEGGWSTDFSTRSLDPTNTILDGNHAGGVLDIYKAGVSASGSVTIEGFTIRNGFTAFDGAGIRMDSFPPGTVTIRRNIIEQNEAMGTGGGFWVSNDDPATQTGGPIHILDNIIRMNIGASGSAATGGGGRVYALNGFLFFNNLVYRNTVGGNPTFAGLGGGLYVSVIGGPIQIINNTVTGNTAYTDAGGINVGSFGLSGFPAQVVQLSNNIIRDNVATTGSGNDIYNQINADPGNMLTIAHNDFHDLVTRTGSFLTPTLLNNIDAAPLFVSTTDPDPLNWDLHLQPDSPCIDTGDNAAPQIPTTDLGGNPRIADGDDDGTAVVDMGGYEFGLNAGLYQGTIGTLTRLLMANPGFAAGKPKVYLAYTDAKGKPKQAAFTVVSFTDTEVQCQWKKKITPGAYPLWVQVKEKDAAPIPFGTFGIMEPEISGLSANNGAVGDSMTVTGLWLTTKPNVYLQDPGTLKKKKCKVMTQTMNATTGESSLIFEVPKLDPGDYTLIVMSKVGQSDFITFTINP